MEKNNDGSQKNEDCCRSVLPAPEDQAAQAVCTPQRAQALRVLSHKITQDHTKCEQQNIQQGETHVTTKGKALAIIFARYSSYLHLPV